MAESHELQPTGSSGGIREEGVSILQVAAVLLRERRLIGRMTCSGIAVSVVIALLRPATYTTTFSFLPQATQDASRAGLASLAGQFGVNLSTLSGTQAPPQLYADLLVTREVLGPIAGDTFSVDPDGTTLVPLPQFLKIRAGSPPIVTAKTLVVLRKDVISTTVAARTTGMVTVSVRTKSPYVSLAIAERLLAGLNHFNIITRQSQAREERRFTEARLADSRAALRTSEDELEHFLQTNRASGSPALAFQRERLQRDVTMHQQIVSALAQQFEENRIREVRDTPVITVVDAPVLAARPDPRSRALILILGTLAAVGASLIFVIAREALTIGGEAGSDPDMARLVSEWRRLRKRANPSEK